jgi:hypothetical protein
MISSLPVPLFNQRDPRWASQRLGIEGSAVNIGQAGCCITCVSMANGAFDPSANSLPNHIDDLFSANPKGKSSDGYADCNLVIWNAINRILPSMSTQGAIYCLNTPAPVYDIKAHLDVNHLAILQVGFGGNPKNMHFVLAVGYNGDDIIFHDPWYGDQVSFASKRYGTGDSSKDILAVHYFADGTPDPVKPPVPVAARPIENPVPPVDPQPVPTPEPVITPVEVPNPQPSPQVENSEWEQSWVHDTTIAPKVVAVPSADVFDPVSGQVVKQLHGGEPVAPIAGYFKTQGNTYYRTQWSFENNKWNGILQSDVKDIDQITPPPTNTGVPVDSIQPPASVEPTGSIFDEDGPELPTPPASTAQIDSGAVVFGWAKALLGLLLTPLRFAGAINNVIKGKIK